MSDYLINLNQNPMTSWLTKAVGLPNPVELARSDEGYQKQPFKGKTALLLSVPGGYAGTSVGEVLTAAGAIVLNELSSAPGARADLVVLDATGCGEPDDYKALYEAFQPILKRIAQNGRILLLAGIPEAGDDPVTAALARGLEGFGRSLGKELGKYGTTVNLAYVAKDAVDRLDGVVRFFCGVQCTYVSGQSFRVTAGVSAPASVPVTAVLGGKVALVTGAAGGIGLATAQRLAQEGARLICLDVPAVKETLDKVCADMGATALALDITGADAPRVVADFVMEHFGGVDVVVHNAGITRDKTLANMKPEFWNQVLSVNLAAILAVDKVLLAEQVLRDEGRMVYLSSMSGIAGNYGQTNYATTKAALIGYVAAQAPLLAARGICTNA
uniref:SDR family NAD(P)-dependent oxidoreductase n=1 Tax=uncultured Marinobacter sp. TaxID=187379 RepID=UPI0030DAC238